MSHNNKDDPFSKLREHQDHQYNPGYWVNRLPFGFPPKRTKGFWILSLIDAFFLIPAFFLMLWLYLTEWTTTLLIPLIILGVGAVLAYLRADSLKPPEPYEIEEMPSSIDYEMAKKKERKKKYPKRQKNYH
jgi:hypothetical protein